MGLWKKTAVKITKVFWPEKTPDFAAKMYADLARKAKTSFYSAVAEEIIQRVDRRRDVKNLFDIGTGPGFLLLEIAGLRPDLPLFGIDLSEKLLDVARRERIRRRLWNVFFSAGNANRLRLPDNACDFVVSTGVLHVLKNPSAAIREWLRVLKPGGDLWVYDPAVLIKVEDENSFRRRREIAEKMGDNLRSGKDRLLFRLMRWIADLPPKPMSYEKIRQIVESAGVGHLASIEDRKDYLKISIVKSKNTC